MSIRITWSGVGVSENERLTRARNRETLVLTARYRAFKKEVFWETKRAMGTFHFPGFGNIPLTMRAVMQLTPKMDTLACMKAICDGMEKAGLYDNDNQLRRFDPIDRTDVGKGDLCFFDITIFPLNYL